MSRTYLSACNAVMMTCNPWQSAIAQNHIECRLDLLGFLEYVCSIPHVLFFGRMPDLRIHAVSWYLYRENQGSPEYIADNVDPRIRMYMMLPCLRGYNWYMTANTSVPLSVELGHFLNLHHLLQMLYKS